MSKRFFLLSLLISAPYSSWAIDPFTIELYQSSCVICHESGAGGAPKSFDENEWQDRLKKGNEILLQNAISGYKGMPPLGMCSDCTQEDLVELITYISTKQAEE